MEYKKDSTPWPCVRRIHGPAIGEYGLCELWPLVIDCTGCTGPNWLIELMERTQGSGMMGDVGLTSEEEFRLRDIAQGESNNDLVAKAVVGIIHYIWTKETDDGD